MANLTQEVFNDCPNWVESALIDKKGKLIFYSLEKSVVARILNNEIFLPFNAVIWGSDYDTTDYQNSAINRNGFRCSDCNFFHVPHQCRTTFCENCDSLLS